MSYIIQNRFGNETDFLEMTRRCAAKGIRIYVDAVINHMAALEPILLIGTAGSIATLNRSYPSVPYEPKDFHRACTIVNYYDAHMVRNCDLYNLPDLDHAKRNVLDKIIEYLNHLITLGVAGFRIDAAKHIWPNDLKVKHYYQLILQQ